MSEKVPKELTGILDRAIVLCSTYVPHEHRNPTPGGGNVLTTATAILVAGRAVVEAVIEYEARSK
jgi:hypothetical protein